MDLTLFRSLVAVADAGTISEAAQRLSITQPALSRRMRQLEDDLGTTLLVRGRKGISMTAIGQLVLDEGRLLTERYDNLVAEVASLNRLDGGTVRIGGGATAVSFLLPGAIAEYQSRYPAVRFEVKEAGSREIAENVIDGRLELGIVTRPVLTREVTETTLLNDEIVLICAPNHPLANATSIATDRLEGLGLVGFEAGSAIRQLIDAALRNAGVEMNVVMELRSIPAIVRMVRTTGNLAFVSRAGLETESDVQILRVKRLDIRRELAVITQRGAQLSPAAASFAAHLSNPTI